MTQSSYSAYKNLFICYFYESYSQAKRIVKHTQTQRRFLQKTHLSYEPDTAKYTLQEYYSRAESSRQLLLYEPLLLETELYESLQVS